MVFIHLTAPHKQFPERLDHELAYPRYSCGHPTGVAGKDTNSKINQQYVRLAREAASASFADRVALAALPGHHCLWRVTRTLGTVQRAISDKKRTFVYWLNFIRPKIANLGWTDTESDYTRMLDMNS